ncbi:MAG TPA: TetR/AcrR family transcriptional regulator [Natronosporangium sp.]
MPRVPEAHLAARRQQIIDAARRCFARNGFQATGMQDVIAEAGLSVGAVYRYFKSKDEIRVAVAEQTVGAITAAVAAIAQHDPPLPVAEAMTRLMAVLEPPLAEPDSAARLAVHSWAEALRDPSFAEFVGQAYRTLRDQFTTIAQRAQAAGELPAAADPAAIGAVLFGLLPGYVLQRVITGTPDQATFVAGLRALLPG